MSKCRQHSNNLIETEIGRIPKDWGLSKLSNIAQIIVSNVDKKVEENEAPVLLCNYMDVYQNEYITSNLEFMRGSASEAEINKFSLRRGDVLITKDSETAEDIASAAFVTDEIRNLICGYHLAILRPDIERMDSNFFAKTLQHDRVHNQFVTKANGVTRYGLTLSVINNATIPVPPLIEQAEIARILSTWDRAIEQVQRLIEAKQRQKKGLMQGLLTGKYRWDQPLPENTRGQTSAQIITWLSQYGESVDRFIHFAEERGISPVQLATAWVRHSPAVTSPIVGVSSLSQLQASIDAFSYDLSDADYAAVTAIFNTEVKEEGLQRFPGLKYNFPRLRRNLAEAALPDMLHTVRGVGYMLKDIPA